MGVSRGSFYWHFADIGAFHAAILKHWREVAAEQVIAGLEVTEDNPLSLLLRGAFGSKQALERAVRSWATVDSKARSAVQAIDRRRVDYVAHMLRQAGVEAWPRRRPRANPVLGISGLCAVGPAAAACEAKVITDELLPWPRANMRRRGYETARFLHNAYVCAEIMLKKR